MRTAAAYTEQLRALLPQGRAWRFDPGGVFAELLDALGVEFARADVRVAGLIEEADPSTTLELLPDWERVAGLPDACLPTSGTVGERQLRAVRKISGIGGQSRAFFIELAAQLGIEIAIEEASPFRIGSRMMERLDGEQWQFVWRVRVLPIAETSGAAIRSSWFRIGSRMGERLRSFSITELECAIRRAAPAHTHVLFAYPVDPEPLLWFDFISDQGDY